MPGVQNVVAVRDVFLHEAVHFRRALDDAGTTDLRHGLSFSASVRPFLAVIGFVPFQGTHMG